MLIGLFFTPYDANAMDQSVKLTGPSLSHLFGTDNFGRDILSRVMEGAGTTFLVAATTVLVGAFIGGLIGAITGYFGGILDEILMRINDGFASFPSILLALVVVSVFGSGKYQIILALGIVFIPSFARVMRGEFLAQKELDYVKNAKLMGANTLRILFCHILPNTKSILFSSILIAFNNAVLAEAGLSYLSLGVQPPDASLGRMLSEAQPFLLLAPWYALAPGLFIVLTILGISLLGETFIEEKQRSFLGFSRKSRVEQTLPRQTVQKEHEKFLLKVEGLSVSFLEGLKQDTVVHEVSFQMKPGEILGIVGESGSGKSMTGYSILGLLPDDAKKPGGSILFDGCELTDLSEAEYEKIRGNKISMVFQEPQTSLNPVFTIGKQVEEVLILHDKIEQGKRKEKVLQMLLETGLSNPEILYDKYPHELSGGMRQRVMIAMAMISSPKLLIADEPTTALDVTIQVKILQILKDLNRKHGTAILMISHDLNVIKQLCERVLVMKDGRVLEEGTVEALFQNPKEEYTKKLVGFSKSVFEDLKRQENVIQNGETILEVNNLNLYYQEEGKHAWSKKQKKQVGKNLNFQVLEGEIFGIVGESGSGKSSLAKAVVGLPFNLEGEINRKETRPQMVFQDPDTSLNPKKTVEWILQEPLRIHGSYSRAEREETVKQWLLNVELSEQLKKRRIFELSGGQRQRVAIAAAAIAVSLVSKKKLLVLDEALSALDVSTKIPLRKLLERLKQEENLSYLFISHDMGDVKQLCDRVLVLQDGEIVEMGNVEEIFHNPKQEYTKELLCAAGIKLNR